MKTSLHFAATQLIPPLDFYWAISLESILHKGSHSTVFNIQMKGADSIIGSPLH